jgi:4-hydroxy-tetrahydrodipicolinate synthase
VVVAGARDITMAIAARRGRADALLAFPERKDPVAYHRRLGRELPVIAFYLYEAAGGVPYDDQTLHAILDLPEVAGLKVATLDSVMTFQRLAALMRGHPDKVLVTGEDRFLGYSIMAGATSALVGMGAALPDVQADLLHAWRDRQWDRFVALSALCDRLAQATFTEPMEGYIRRMLWAAAADGALPRDACDDPWGPALPEGERSVVEQAVAGARAARA